MSSGYSQLKQGTYLIRLNFRDESPYHRDYELAHGYLWAIPKGKQSG